MTGSRDTPAVCLAACLALVLIAAAGCTGPGAQARAAATSGPADKATVGRLVEQLGSDSFEEREASQKALVEMGQTAVAALGAAADDKDPERSHRAREALNEIKDFDNAAWCPLVRGLQAGATLGRPHYPYRLGETVVYNMYLNNFMDHPVTLVLQEPAAWTAAVYRERGDTVGRRAAAVKSGPAPAERTVTLAPGEKWLVGAVQLKLDATPKDEPAGPHIFLEPGQYHVDWTGRVKEPGQADGFEISAFSPLLMVAGPAEPAGKAPPAAPPDAAKPSSVAVYRVAGSPQGEPEKVALADLELAPEPFLTDKDIVTYYWGDHIIQLTPGAFQGLLQTRPSSGFFVVVADGRRCFLGAVVSLISSYIPKVPLASIWTSRQQVLPENAIRIGPGMWNPQKPDEKDVRNDPRLLQALERLGKLPAGEKSPASPNADDKPTAPPAGQ